KAEESKAQNLLRTADLGKERIEDLLRDRRRLQAVAEEIELLAAKELGEELVQQRGRIAQRDGEIGGDGLGRPVTDAAQHRHDRRIGQEGRRVARETE